MGDANQTECRYCGKPFTPKRATGLFCTETHRKSFFKRRMRQERRLRESARRAGMALTFDGRIVGQPRDGFGLKPRVSAPLYFGPPCKKNIEQAEEEETEVNRGTI
jgi:hypothetical protein